MKKILTILTTTTILAMSIVSCNKDDNAPTIPGWDTAFGRATFATDTTWTIISSDGTITQEWSDAVQTVDCSDKTTYLGWDTLGYKVDCRSNPDQKGDLFSWRAVSEFKDELCPEGWRVPTKEDFINLDKILGGNGENRNAPSYIQFITDNYIARWGGAFGNFCHDWGTLNTQGILGAYWSQSEDSADRGNSLNIRGTTTSGLIYPQGRDEKGYGYTVRCVR